MRGKWILFAGITVLVAVAAGAISMYRQNASRKVPVEAPPPAARVVNAPVSELSLAGPIQAQRVVNVPVPVDGTVESYAAEIGQDVFEGQLIAHIRNTRLDSAAEAATLELERLQSRVRELEAAIVAGRLEASRASADLSRLRTDFERVQKAYQRQQLLYKEGATPRLVFEKAESEFHTTKDELDTKNELAQQSEERVADLNRQLDAAKRALEEREQIAEQAKANIAAGEVRSPVDGIVVSRRGQAGDQVNRAMPDLFRIAVALSAMEVTVQPEPALVARIKVGQPASVHVAEVPDEIAGTVREIKDGRVVVDFTSPAPVIHPGMTAQVRLKLS